MKKVIFSFIGAAIIACTVVFNISISSRGESMSDLALENIEALAQSETGDEFTGMTCCQACWDDHNCTACDGNVYSFAHRI